MNREQTVAQAALGALVIDLHVEASRHPDLKAQLIAEQAAAVDHVRVGVITGATDLEVAWAYVDEGRVILARHVLDRCVADHPARRIIRERLDRG